MEIRSVASFLKYYAGIRKRTERAVACIPSEQIEWTYREGKFTLGDQVRHIAATERDMFAENVAGRPSRYAGCGVDKAAGYDETIAYFQRMHDESLAIFSALSDDDLDRKCTTPGGAELAVWKWLRAMIEHEVHHRAQIHLYLVLLGIPAPALYGLTAEEVQERSVS